MFAPVTLPFWVVAFLVIVSAWALVSRLLMPSVRWFLRRRINRVLDQVNRRLPIRIQTFKLTKRRVLVDRLLYDPQVLEAAETYAREQEMPREVVMAKLARYADEIVPAFNAYFYFRVAAWLARGVAQTLFRVRLGFADDKALSEIAPGSAVVFVMNHRSNMDYILVSYLAAERTALSYAVGEWARIWPLQTLIRATGAYFVRRNSRDGLYRKVLERYVAMATSAGVTQAIYPEGRLSRDGALQPPRMGLLDYMLRAFDPSGDRDIVFVPVGINYDRTLEDRTLLIDVRDDATRPKAGGAAWNALRFLGRNLLLMAGNKWHRFGYACVNFGSPLSLQSYMKERSLDFRPLSKEDRFARVGELGQELMSRVAAVVPVLPVSLVATVLVEEEGRSFGELELKARVYELMEELAAKGAHVYIPRNDQGYAIDVGLRMLTLRHLIDQEDGLYKVRAGEAHVLRYYANSIAHHLARRAAEAA